MKRVSASVTDPGRRRDHNEDRYLADDALGLYVVCDGAGGHEAGEVAADQAIRGIARAVHRRLDMLDHIRSAEDRVRDSTIIAMIEDAVIEVMRDLKQFRREHPEADDMRTTLTLLLFLKGRAVMAHVGDSRCYLVRRGRSVQLSDDHTITFEFLRRGMIAPEDARRNQYRHSLSQAMGSNEPIHVDTLLFDIIPGDRYVLCSDGLSNYFDDEDDDGELLALPHADPEAVAEHLVAWANDRGGLDNITVVVVQTADE